MNPLAMIGGGGMSVSDSTSVTFNPFADQGKTSSNNIYVKSSAPLSLEAFLPIILIGGIALLVWKLLK